MPHHALTETDHHLVRLHGTVDQVDGITVVRVPDNPGYRWGNCIHLPDAPHPNELEGFLQLARDLFIDQPQSTHAQVRWDGDFISEELAALAEAKGLQHDSGQAMHADALVEVEVDDIEIRPMDMEDEWKDIVELNIACDPEEIDGVADYIEFKQGLRRAWRAWEQTGDATWWGAFIDERLVGQAGMVRCPGGRGRFQSVETHPEFRRRGVCSTLTSQMGNHALRELDCDTLLLGVNHLGLAIHAYRRLGFTTGQWQNGLAIVPS
jgi:ribosomal protein S18 acetylase RimI-like enzyme